MITIVPARDEDGPELIRLIASVFDEYPGCVLDVEGEEPDLLEVATAFGERDGRFWVAVKQEGPGAAGRRVVGCIGYQPSRPTVAEVKKLYVEAAHRRRGTGERLLNQVLRLAAERGRSVVECWSDTRFFAGHAFYLRHGFVATGATRELGDRSGTTEKHFRRVLVASLPPER